MEKMVELLLNADNVRMVLIVILGFCGYVKLNSSFDKKLWGLEKSLLKAMYEKIDTKLGTFYTQLKTNDFAHLNNTIEALTFMLEKNKFLEKEDKEFIDKQLDR